MNIQFTFYKNNSAKIRVFFKTCLLFLVLCFTVPLYLTGQVKTTSVKSKTQTTVTSSKTIKSVPTTVTTKEMILIYDTDATCKFSVTGMNFTECGVCYSTKSGPTIEGAKAKSSGTEMDQQIKLSPLTPETKYYVRAYLKEGSTIVYGNELTFTTQLPLNREKKTKTEPQKGTTNPG